MATFKEQFDSGVGSSSGADGFINWTRHIHVFAEDSDFIKRQGPDGETVIPPVPEALVELNFAGRGTLHPENGTLAVTGYRRGLRHNEKTWSVSILYSGTGSAEPLPTDYGWRVSIRGASLTRRIIEPLPRSVSQLDPPKPGAGGRPLRPRPRPLSTLNQTDAVDEPELIGPMVFQSVPVETEDTDHYYIRTGQDNISQSVWLIPSGRRNVVGFQTEVPAITVVYTKIAANFRVNPTAALMAHFIKAVNHVGFRGADPGHVLCDTITVDPIETTMLGQRVPGLAWRIAVSFFWSAEVLTPWTIVPTVQDDQGHEYVVYNRDGTKATESFRVRRTRDLNQLLVLLTEGAS